MISSESRTGGISHSNCGGRSRGAQNLPAARRLVESVNVLGHHRGQLPRTLQLGQLSVGCVGLSIWKSILLR